MANIRKRNRNYEKSISSEYIRSLNEAYNQFFLNYSDTPLLIVNSTEIDFVNKEEDFEDLIQQFARPIPGTQYYSPVKK